MTSDTASLASSLDLGSLPKDSSSTLVSLNRLLERLESTLLASKAPRSLRHNPYQRSRVGANLEHARTLLLRLEHDSSSPNQSGSSTPKPFASRVSSGISSKLLQEQSGAVSKTELQQKRVLIKRLQDALHKLDDEDGVKPTSTEGPGLAAHSGVNGSSKNIDSSEDEDDEDDEDLLSRYAPAVRASSGLNTDRGSNGTPLDPQKAAAAAAATMVASSLRSRNNAPPAAQATATGREQVQSGPGQSLPTTVPFAPAPSSKPNSHAQLLESHDAEQDQLTSSLLTLASALKQSTTSFSETLLGSEGLVDQAAAALDKNVGGMESASGRMGLLRRVTEGRGWWARLGLYAKIGILWALIILLVFVAPKLRF